jgi:hypothetical protein
MILNPGFGNIGAKGWFYRTSQKSLVAHLRSEVSVDPSLVPIFLLLTGGLPGLSNVLQQTLRKKK